MSKRRIRENIIPTKNKEKIFFQEQKTAMYQGLIPPASIIEGYEKNCSGATDRIIKMAERQLEVSQEIAKLEQKNIAECRKEALNIEGTTTKRGQVLGFVLLLIMLIGGFTLVIIGKDIGGYASIVCSITIAIGSVLWRNNQNQKK